MFHQHVLPFTFKGFHAGQAALQANTILLGNGTGERGVLRVGHEAAGVDQPATSELLAWLAVVMSVPIAGAAAYLMFGELRLVRNLPTDLVRIAMHQATRPRQPKFVGREFVERMVVGLQR